MRMEDTVTAEKVMVMVTGDMKEAIMIIPMPAVDGTTVRMTDMSRMVLSREKERENEAAVDLLRRQ